MPGINIVPSVFSLADRTLDLGKLDLHVSLASAGSNGIEPLASLCADKVIICAPCFILFVVYSLRNPTVYRTSKKVVFC